MTGAIHACNLAGMASDDNPPPAIDDLVALETTVWQALADGDAAATTG